MTMQRYSDLVVSPDGRPFLKAGPGQGLAACPGDLRDEALAAGRAALEAWQADPRAAFRLELGGVSWRVASLEGLGGRTFFLRRMPESVPEFASLGLPSGLASWFSARERQKGLILISGAQASGKSTTAASLVASRLAEFGGHAVTFESPAEMPLDGRHGQHGFCFQSELEDETGLALAIEQAHRFASPDIILVGEIRTRHAAAQTLRAALGSDRQLVVATIHGLDLIAALDRLLTLARELDGEAAAHNLSQSLLAVVHQRLTPTPDNGPRLSVPQFLLLEFSNRSKAMRAKLRSGDLRSLEDDMREQLNRLTFGGRA
ncbi:ATPase, T2SS/T4P/T4SS family [Pseudodesulfovibrio tunisiensis]|uniref:ATPase, T2SS/T4P/T4SS family n=1 Tax=Pseudodesulfovibrio tunisiensis TaxID=463192 RepID=UPI001FB30471|nr:ATPase, T2SS/T4P/T4SS family [Pseudodesulfovibrio tunisiensis]